MIVRVSVALVVAFTGNKAWTVAVQAMVLLRAVVDHEAFASPFVVAVVSCGTLQRGPRVHGDRKRRSQFIVHWQLLACARGVLGSWWLSGWFQESDPNVGRCARTACQLP